MSMATTGYATIKEFQKAELVIAPSIKTEGKTYQSPSAWGWARGDLACATTRGRSWSSIFGAQYAQLIARRIREAHVYSEIVPYDATLEELEAKRPAGISCPAVRPSCTSRARRRSIRGCSRSGFPVLGICYGHQLMAQALGGGSPPPATASTAAPAPRRPRPGVLLTDLPAARPSG